MEMSALKFHGNPIIASNSTGYGVVTSPAMLKNIMRRCTRIVYPRDSHAGIFASRLVNLTN